jgi:hypothetical protein
MEDLERPKPSFERYRTAESGAAASVHILGVGVVQLEVPGAAHRVRGTSRPYLKNVVKGRREHP